MEITLLFLTKIEKSDIIPKTDTSTESRLTENIGIFVG